jgi:carboxypeptidase C (cathepsin A)
MIYLPKSNNLHIPFRRYPGQVPFFPGTGESMANTSRFNRSASMLLAGVLLSTVGVAQTDTESTAISHGQVVTPAATLHYTAKAELLPVRDNDTGALMGQVFVVAYTLDRPAGQPKRPITFIWGGGPGSNSSETHLLGFGPKGLRTPATFPEWTRTPPAEIIDRPDTWLSSSDLVFVDPIGTGYSRITDERFRAALYSRRGDVETVAEIIRIYCTREGATDAPLFLVGESYGAERAMGVAEALEKRRRHVAGVVLISGNYDTGQSVPPAVSEALYVPTFAAAAYWHKKLSPQLQALSQEEVIRRATDWAKSSYAPALERPGPDSRNRKILEELEVWTGIEAKHIDPKTLQLDEATFADQLLPGKALGRYDLRMAGAARAADNPIWVPTTDPSIEPMLGLMQGGSPALQRYLRSDLKFKSDLLYAGPFGEAFHPTPLRAVAPQIWGPFDDWMTMKWDFQETHKTEQAAALSGPAAAEPPPEMFKQPPPLRRAMDLDPNLKLMSVMGLYDAVVGTCAEREEAISRSEADIRQRTRTRCYAAGHAVYTDNETRAEFQRDFAQFVRDASRTMTLSR